MRNTHSGNHYLRAVSWIVKRLTGDPFDEWLNQRLNAGDSYRTIARDLATLTDDVVDVTGESVRRWVLEFDELKAAA